VVAPVLIDLPAFVGEAGAELARWSRA
jgi:hypothetical protein